MSCNTRCFVMDDGMYCRVASTQPNFTRVGVLIHETHGPLPLYGRRRASRSDDWLYFTETTSETPQSLPVIFKKRNCYNQTYRACDELQTDDVVSVQGFPDKVFRVSLFYR